MAHEASVESAWITAIRNSHAIHNITSYRPELPFWLVRWDGEDGLEWIDLTDPQQTLKPFHFEIYFGKRSLRDQHYREAMQAASKCSTPIVRELFGVWDMFYALPSDEECQNFLYIGQFYREAPDWETISGQWELLSGREAATANPDFFHFVRMALSTPVVGDALLAALSSFTQEFALLLTGRDDGPEFHARVNALNRDAFCELWPVEEWVASAISPDKFHLAPWYLDGRLTQRMKDGLGISRLPTTVMTLMPVDPRSEALDPVQTLVRNARIQRACIAHVRTMPDAAACRLQDYGVSIITSTRSRTGTGPSRIELRERALQLLNFVQEEFGMRAVVGIGSTQPPGSGLHPSHRDSVRALQNCVQLDEAVVFHEDHEARPRVVYADVQKALRSLEDAVRCESNTGLRLASDRYVQEVLAYSDERVEVVRGQFLAGIFQLFSDFERRRPIDAESRDRFARDMATPIERAHSLEQVVDAFNQSLRRLNYVSSRTLEGSKLLRLEVTLQYLQEHYAEHLPLPHVARKAGFSVPAFSRFFKKATGTSFLAYLRGLRIEHAKRLLTTSSLTTEEVAQACGFQSQHHLIRSFKKTLNDTPGAYRKEHALH